MERIDLTLPITPQMMTDAQGNEKKALSGHLGTHFDVMDKIFPLSYTEREGVVFDVSSVEGKEIECTDLDLSLVKDGMFVAFSTGFVERVGYGTKEYFSTHPQLSFALIETLLEKKVSMIGVDFAGVRRGREHTPTDQKCADKGVFIIENLCCLSSVVEKGGRCHMHTYPMNYLGLSGLPCRVVAEL